MKVVFVNGGSRGIGAAIVRKFSAVGYKAVFTYKNSEKEASLLAKECGALAICADSSSSEEAFSAVSRAIEVFGHIDVLVNNAAVSHFSLLTDMTYEDWHFVMSNNLDSVFYYSKAVLPCMINRKYGKIINISSMWGETGASMEVAYSASKAGIIGFTKALAKELGPSGITVNAVSPGVINTDMNSHLSLEDMEALKEETPVCRIGEPLDVANACFFLAEDTSGFITGQVLGVNGGFLI